MKEWKGTKGEVTIEINERRTLVLSEGKAIIDFWHFDEQSIIFQNENVKLFTGALNTIQKCDLMPSELLAENLELKKQIENSQNIAIGLSMEFDSLWNKTSSLDSDNTIKRISRKQQELKQSLNTK